MPAKKKSTSRSRSSNTRAKKSFVDPAIVVTIACIVIGGLIFVLYASAATVNSIVQ